MIVDVTGQEAAPATFDLGWLPDGDFWPDLSEARANYERIYTAWQETGAERQALSERLAGADEQRKADLRNAYLTGTEPPAAESDDQLKADLEAATERANAAGKALLDHINACVALVAEKRPEWLGEIDGFDLAVERKVAELQAQIAELRGRKNAFWRLRHWVDRTGGPAAELPALHMAYSAIDDPAPQDGPERDAWIHKRSLESYAGGLPGAVYATEEQIRAAERELTEDDKREPIEEQVS